MTETILITGANRGIGLELARSFLARNWQVLACCREPQRADELQQLAASAEMLEILPLEVTDADQIATLAQALAGRPIDILFHNAGLFGSKQLGFRPIDEDEWLEVLRVNLIAPQKLTEALLANVAASRRKIIACMGSQLGCIGDNSSGGWTVYRTSKAAVHMLMRTLACDLKERGITAVAFHPGWVRTRMGGAEAPLEPADAASALTQRLLELTPTDSGCLIHMDGRRLGW